MNIAECSLNQGQDHMSNITYNTAFFQSGLAGEHNVPNIIYFYGFNAIVRDEHTKRTNRTTSVHLIVLLIELIMVKLTSPLPGRPDPLSAILCRL
jgi:hypothetical protein